MSTALPDLFTLAMLEQAVGGSSRLYRMCGARDRNDAVLAAFFDEVRRAANGEVYSIIGVDLNVTDPNIAAADIIRQYALDVAAFWAHKKGTDGQAIPDGIRAARAEAIEALKEFRSGMRRLDTVEEPARSAPAQQVDMDPDRHSGWTRDRWGGLA